MLVRCSVFFPVMLMSSFLTKSLSEPTTKKRGRQSVPDPVWQLTSAFRIYFSWTEWFYGIRGQFLTCLVRLTISDVKFEPATETSHSPRQFQTREWNDCWMSFALTNSIKQLLCSQIEHFELEGLCSLKERSRPLSLWLLLGPRFQDRHSKCFVRSLSQHLWNPIASNCLPIQFEVPASTTK